MDNKSDDKLLTTQATIDANRQQSDKKMNTYESKLDKLTEMMEKIMDQIEISNSSPEKMD